MGRRGGGDGVAGFGERAIAAAPRNPTAPVGANGPALSANQSVPIFPAGLFRAAPERVGQLQGPPGRARPPAGRARSHDPGERPEPRAQPAGDRFRADRAGRAHVTGSLIRRGQSNYSNLYDRLRLVEARYGVDSTVLLAIYGHETSYGL